MSDEFTANTTRREVLKKTAFVAPVILTLPAVPSFASAGSDNRSGPAQNNNQGQNNNQQ